jgi:hypothetical protein
VFFLNAEGTIYGRFGARSDQIQLIRMIDEYRDPAGLAQ